MELQVDIVWGKKDEYNNLRNELRKALNIVKVLPCWNEYSAKKKEKFNYFKDIKENIIIINGHVIYNSSEPSMISSKELAVRITNFNTFPRLKKRLNISTSWIAALLISLMPKCPFCFAAYLGIFGITGLEVMPYYTWIKYLLVSILIIVIALITFRAKKRNVFIPMYFMVPGAIVLMFGKMFLQSDILTVTGLVLVLAASILNAYPFSSNTHVSFKRNRTIC